MARPPFSVEELKPTGKFYPSMKGFMGRDFPAQPVYNRPITPRENWKIYMSGQKPWWIPTSGWFNCEVNQFRPRINPDNVANHQIFDGGPEFDYEPQGFKVLSSWFDMVWEWVPDIAGATVHPGDKSIRDINHWQDYVSIPDLDAMDWETCKNQNVEYLNVDKLNELGIQCGMWERLMNLMDVVDACCALVEEDQKPGVHSFFDALCKFYDDYIGRMKAVCNIDGIVFHDDWAHKLGSFFSPATAREMFLPYISRLVKSCSSRGMFYDVHLCGMVEQILDVFVEAGCNMWSGQTELNDMDWLLKRFKDTKFIIGMPAPVFDPENPVDDATAKEMAKEWVDKYKDYRVSLFNFMGVVPQAFYDGVYEYSRKAYENA
jgi:hypothetical protein